ncbi:Acetate kinase [Sphingomonas antarctica]|uniref:acetate/propionate family kinase n=1 Tax=Sphingomonas antarctica TaxID=2040274 RepID=UPI0039EA291A
MIILTLNSGSSSLKFGLFDTQGVDVRAVMSGEKTGRTLRASDASGTALPDVSLADDNPITAVGIIRNLVSQAAILAPQAIGHRVVHGGTGLREHCRIDDRVLEQLRLASAMSPLHAPAAISMIEAAETAFPGLPQVACFDTTFHAGMPEVARTLPLPRALRDAGIQRFGFHGLSCESIVHQLGDECPARLIVAHLGSGSSVTAIRDGRSIDTSMGFTPSGGVLMGTRSGELDPGVIIYLLREKGYDFASLEQLVDHQSGMLGISGVSGDMRRLHAAEIESRDCQLAVEMFYISVAKQIAAMMVSLGGLDLLVFTGGIGEHDGDTREEVCGRLACLGVELAISGPRSASGNPAGFSSRCGIRVLMSEENNQIARHAYRLLTT